MHWIEYISAYMILWFLTSTPCWVYSGLTDWPTDYRTDSRTDPRIHGRLVRELGTTYGLPFVTCLPFQHKPENITLTHTFESLLSCFGFIILLIYGYIATEKSVLVHFQFCRFVEKLLYLNNVFSYVLVDRRSEY